MLVLVRLCWFCVSLGSVGPGLLAFVCPLLRWFVCWVLAVCFGLLLACFVVLGLLVAGFFFAVLSGPLVLGPCLSWHTIAFHVAPQRDINCLWLSPRFLQRLDACCSRLCRLMVEFSAVVLMLATARTINEFRFWTLPNLIHD